MLSGRSGSTVSCAGPATRLGFAPDEAPAEHLTLHVDSDPAGLGQSLSPCTSNKPQGYQCCWTQGPHLLCLENPMSPRPSRGPLEFPPLQCRDCAQLSVLHGASTTPRVLTLGIQTPLSVLTVRSLPKFRSALFHTVGWLPSKPD